MSQNFETQVCQQRYGFNLFLRIREIVEQDLGHLLITSSSSYFFNKTDLEQYFFIAIFTYTLVYIAVFVNHKNAMIAIKRLRRARIALMLLYVFLDVIKYYIVYDHSVLRNRTQKLQDLPSKHEKNALSEKEAFTKSQFSANSVKGIRTETLSLSKQSQKPRASITKLTHSEGLETKLAVSVSSKSNCEFWKYPYRVEFNGSSFLTLDPKRFLYPAI